MNWTEALKACIRIHQGNEQEGDQRKCEWLTRILTDPFTAGFWPLRNVYGWYDFSRWHGPEIDYDEFEPGEFPPIPHEFRIGLYIRELLVNELIVNALVDDSLSPGLLKDIRDSGVYAKVLRNHIDQIETATKDMRTKLSILERATGQIK